MRTLGTEFLVRSTPPHLDVLKMVFNVVVVVPVSLLFLLLFLLLLLLFFVVVVVVVVVVVCCCCCCFCCSFCRRRRLFISLHCKFGVEKAEEKVEEKRHISMVLFEGLLTEECA